MAAPSEPKKPARDVRFPPSGGLKELLPNADFAFRMNLKRGDANAFFAPSPNASEILNQRSRWLAESPHEYLHFTDPADPVIREFAQSACLNGFLEINHQNPDTMLRRMGEHLEPDLLFLRPLGGEHKVVAGVVCFPSSWALLEKIGRPLSAVHAPAPTLNAQLQSPIETFLQKIKSGVAWERSNWGLSRSAELNQHPSRHIPRLDHHIRPDEVWFRVERQILIGLNSGIAFGIKLENHPLEALLRDPELKEGLEAALRTMPREIADYKGIEPARATLLQWASAPQP